MTAPILIIAIGNDARGDDALAPLLARRLQAEGIAQAEIIEEYQLQVEHVTDLAGRSAALFVDADVSCDAPCRLSKIAAAQDNSFTSHAMSPSALLYAFRQMYGEEAPPSYSLSIRGYGFELGDALSPEAERNLEQAAEIFLTWLADIRAPEE